MSVGSGGGGMHASAYAETKKVGYLIGAVGCKQTCFGGKGRDRRQKIVKLRKIWVLKKYRVMVFKKKFL